MIIRRLGKLRLAVATLLIVIVAAAVSVPLAVLGQGPPRPPHGAQPQPPSPSLLPRPPATQPEGIREEMLRARQAIQSGGTSRVVLSDGSVLEASAGPATRGQPINAGGVTLQLPADVYIGGIAIEGYGPSSPGRKELPLPAYRLVRGAAIAWVSEQTGAFQIAPDSLAPDSRRLFQFLVEALGPEKEIPYPLTMP